MSRSVFLATLGALALFLACLLMIRKETRRSTIRTQSFASMLFGLIGAGRLGAWRDHLAHTAATASSDQTAVWVGVSIPYLVALFIVFWTFLDLDFDGLYTQIRTKIMGGGGGGGRGRGIATTGAPAAGGGLLLKVNKHKAHWYTPLLALLVMPSLAVCPVVGGIPDGLRDGIVRLAVMLGLHLAR